MCSPFWLSAFCLIVWFSGFSAPTWYYEHIIQPVPLQLSEVIVISLFYCAISLTAVIGNFTVILIVLTSRRMQVPPQHPVLDSTSKTCPVCHQFLHRQPGFGRRHHRPVRHPLPGKSWRQDVSSCHQLLVKTHKLLTLVFSSRQPCSSDGTCLPSSVPSVHSSRYSSGFPNM